MQSAHSMQASKTWLWGVCQDWAEGQLALVILYSTLYAPCTSFSTASASRCSNGSDSQELWLVCTAAASHDSKQLHTCTSTSKWPC